MEKRALVIVGAGASHDLVEKGRGQVNDQYKPPLTKDIFVSDHDAVRDVIGKYEGARALASTVNNRVAGGENIEEVLRDLMGAEATNRQEEAKELPLYLQDLFALVSSQYAPEPVNYTDLVGRLFDAGLERLVFVTLNYDLLLEKVLERPVWGGPISDMRDYIGEEKKCSLVKLHGSVNWARRFKKIDKSAVQAEDQEPISKYRLMLSRTPVKGNLEDKVFLADPGEPRWREGLPHYPALAVPTGEYQFVCPPPHVALLRDFLRSCTHVLIIGASGQDKKLLSLLKQGLPKEIDAFYAVGKPQVFADEAARRFKQVRALKDAKSSKVFGQGFTDFLTERGVEALLGATP